MFYGQKRKLALDNLVKSLREIVSQAKKYNVDVMLENVPLSNGVHSVHEFKYVIDNVDMLFVHLDIPHAFTSGGMASIIEYINTFRDKIIHIHWQQNAVSIVESAKFRDRNYLISEIQGVLRYSSEIHKKQN
jgi:sugar phosphate isomerase/epimerase